MKSTAALIFVTSLTFMQASHPIALMALILLQTLFCCLFLASYAVSSWFSFILFLIFLGGLMVLFIYISSLASNEKFVVSLKKTHLSLFTVIGLPMMIAATWHSQTAAYNYSNEVNLLTKMYTTNIFTPTVTVMSYLLLTLIVVVKMTSKYEGPLRNIIFK